MKFEGSRMTVWLFSGPRDGRRAMHFCRLGGQRVDDTRGAPPFSKSSPSRHPPPRLGGAVLASKASGPEGDR